MFQIEIGAADHYVAKNKEFHILWVFSSEPPVLKTVPRPSSHQELKQEVIGSHAPLLNQSLILSIFNKLLFLLNVQLEMLALAENQNLVYSACFRLCFTWVHPQRSAHSSSEHATSIHIEQKNANTFDLRYRHTEHRLCDVCVDIVSETNVCRLVSVVRYPLAMQFKLLATATLS